MAVKIKKGGSYSAKKAEASVEIEKKSNGQTLTNNYTEMVDSGALMEGPTASVSFKAGVTKNLGDYNSARVDVMLTMPTLPTEEYVNSAFEFAQKWVDDKLTEISDSLDGEDE